MTLDLEIRPITLKDTDARHRFWIQLSDEQIGMVHEPHEIDLHTHETHDKILDFLRNRRGLWLVALNSHEIIGEIDLSIKNLSRIRHIASLTMGVLKANQGQGIGTKLMAKSLEWAAAQQLKRIELYVFASNIKAQNLYKKYGFVLEGVRKNFLKISENSYEDDFLMAKYL